MGSKEIESADIPSDSKKMERETTKGETNLSLQSCQPSRVLTLEPPRLRPRLRSLSLRERFQDLDRRLGSQILLFESNRARSSNVVSFERTTRRRGAEGKERKELELEETYVEIIPDSHHRGIRASTQTLYFDESELPIGRGLTGEDVEVFLDGFEDGS